MRNRQIVWFVIILSGILAVSVLLRACKAPPPSLLQPTTDRHEDVFRPTAMAATLGPGQLAAHAMVRQPPAKANVQGGLPVIAAYRTRPIIGDPAGFVVAWTTRPSPAYPEGPLGPATYPDQPVALLVSVRPTQARELPGSRGGYLQVRPDHILTPKPGGILTQSGGTIHLTLPEELLPALRGIPFYMQLVVGDSRTTAGVVLSPMFEMIVGDL